MASRAPGVGVGCILAVAYLTLVKEEVLAMASLVLEDGSEYRGNTFGACRSTPGEVGKGLFEIVR